VLRLFASTICLLALCGCNSIPESPVSAAIASPPAATPAPSPRVAHEGSRIGASFFPVAPGSASALGSDRGLVVGAVVPGGAASKAGIVKGDVLLSVDGTPVNSLSDLTAAVNAAASNHSAQFEMSRDGVARDITIPL
jgi:membrane-associated protease RseP (regulator of RpoE activity)